MLKIHNVKWYFSHYLYIQRKYEVEETTNKPTLGFAKYYLDFFIVSLPSMQLTLLSCHMTTNVVASTQKVKKR